MILLSEVIFKVGCRAAEPERLDPVLAFGVALATGDHGQGDPELSARLTRQVAGYRGRHAAMMPTAPGGSDILRDVLHDLYRPSLGLDEDGLLHVRFPWPDGEPLNHELLGFDWRVAGLVWFEVLVARARRESVDRVVVEALRPAGDTVYAMFSMDMLEAFEKFLGVLKVAELRDSRTPGPICPACSVRANCRPWSSYLETAVASQIKGLPNETKAQRLLAERVDLDVKLEVLTKAQREVDRLFRDLAADGRVSLGAGMGIALPKATGRRWDFKRVYNILSNAGIDGSGLFDVSEKKMEDLLPNLPPAVRARLEQVAAIPYPRESSVKEAIRHASRTGAVQNSILGGVSSRRSGPV